MRLASAGVQAYNLADVRDENKLRLRCQTGCKSPSARPVRRRAHFGIDAACAPGFAT